MVMMMMTSMMSMMDGGSDILVCALDVVNPGALMADKAISTVKHLPIKVTEL